MGNGGIEQYRVMLVVQSLRMGGAETMVEALANALVRHGCFVRVVVLQAEETIISERLRESGVPLTMMGKRPGIDLSLIGRLTREMKLFKPYVVHSHLPILHYVVPSANRAGVPILVHTLHNIAYRETRSRIKAAFNGRCYRSGRVIPVALSEINQQGIIERYHLKAADIPIVPNGIDLSRYKRRSTFSTGEVFEVVNIARFEEAKNHTAIVEAAEILGQRGIKTRFHLYGTGSLRQRTADMVKAKGLSDAIIFHGVTDDVPAALASADAFVLPSLYEGMPMVLIEAMASGLPIIASRVGGIPDMVDDGVSALLCEPRGDSIADGLERLASDEALRIRLGSAAAEQSQLFGSDAMASRYLSVYARTERGCA